VASSYPEAIADYVEAQIRRNDDAIEEMCERMLVQDGTDYGVLVYNNGDGTITTGLSPLVPFGEIHYMLLPPNGAVFGIEKGTEG
jgi:hypothetical protein